MSETFLMKLSYKPRADAQYFYLTQMVKYGAMLIRDATESSPLPGSLNESPSVDAIVTSEIYLTGRGVNSGWPRSYTVADCKDGRRLEAACMMSDGLVLEGWIEPERHAAIIHIGSLQDLMLLRMAYSL